MKIYYFEDLEIIQPLELINIANLIKCDVRQLRLVKASNGYTNNTTILEGYSKSTLVDSDDICILTNCVYALNNLYCWNEKENRCDCYFISYDEFMFLSCYSINDLTNREIRMGHNIEHMYRNNGLSLSNLNK